MEEIKKSEIIIYKAQEGPELQVQMDGETVWLTRAQMAKLFDRDINTIGEHIRYIYAEKELEQSKTTLKQGKTGDSGIASFKPNIYYNLDVVISVGYRVKSKRGTQFRVWATQRLRDYLLKGYAVNEKRLMEEHDLKMKELQETSKLFQQVLENRRAEGYEKDLLKIITDYSGTWAILNKYDKGELKVEGVSKHAPAVLAYEDLKKEYTGIQAKAGRKKRSRKFIRAGSRRKISGCFGKY